MPNINGILYAFLSIIQVFTGPVKPSRPEQPWPCGRTFASLTPLVDPEKAGHKLCGCGPVLKQKVLLLWGKDTGRTICDEAWLLDLESCSWTQVECLSSSLHSRL